MKRLWRWLNPMKSGCCATPSRNCNASRLDLRPRSSPAASASRVCSASHGGRAPRPARTSTGLRHGELEVLSLVNEGLQNSEIAQRLVVSVRTVEHHVEAILRKLGPGPGLTRPWPPRSASTSRPAEARPGPPTLLSNTSRPKSVRFFRQWQSQP